MKVHALGLKNIMLGLIIVAIISSGFAHAANTNSPTAGKLAAITPVKAASPKLLVINEFSSYGTAGSEWVELYNPNATEYANYTDLKLSDQDGNVVNISSSGITSIPPHDYLVVRMGTGTNDTDFSDGHATVYAGFSGDILNDDGDDILLYNGTYGTKDCDYIDYIAYYNGGPNADLDQPPKDSGMTFEKDGTGYYGYIPAPGPHQSVSLVPNGDDENRAGNWYITRTITINGRYDNSITPGLHNANILLVNITDIAPVNQTQGTEVAVLKYTLTAIGGNIEIYKTFVQLKGTIMDNELEAGMYMDTNNDGKWDPGDQKIITGYATFSGHNTTFATPNIYIQVGHPQTFFITVKLDKNASVFENYSLILTDMDTGTWSDNIHTDEVYIVKEVQTKYVRISPTDQTAPYVERVSFDGKTPFGPGTHRVYVSFDKSMIQNVTPLVTYGIYGYEYTIKGAWVTDNMWSGEFNITDQSPSGLLTLKVSNARDIYWNEMVPYSTTFSVDVTRPFVKNVMYNGVSPFPASFQMNITVQMSEPVQGLSAKIIGERHEFIINDIYAINSTAYYLSFNTEMLRTGNYQIEIYGGMDAAGNMMYVYESNFTVDASIPIISDVNYPLSVVEGQNVTFLVYATDNIGVARVWAVYEYNGQDIKVYASRAGNYWEFQVVGGAVKPGTVTVQIYVQDDAGNIFKDEETITVIPWWQAMWWLWVILAVIFGIIIFLVYDVVKRSKLRAQLGEDLVSEAIVVRMAKKFKREKSPEKKKKPKKKKKRKKEVEDEEDEEEAYIPPVAPDIPVREVPTQKPKGEKEPEIPEVPYGEDEYFDEETVERDE